MQMQAAMRRKWGFLHRNYLKADNLFHLDSGSIDALSRQSTEDVRATSPTPTLHAQPMTPLDRNRQYGSVRSILREANTPGSGQNVRFFSRDAYKVISPDTSASAPDSSAEHAQSQPDFAQKMQEAAIEHGVMTPGSKTDETRFHSANPSPNVFSSPDANETQFHSAGTPSQSSSSPIVGEATNYQSANAFTPGSEVNMTNYESAHGLSNGFSGATTFHSPSPGTFLEDMPDAQSTPYTTPHHAQAQSIGLGLPTPPPQLSELGQSKNRNSGSSNEFERAVRGASSIRPTINTQTGNRVSSHSTASSMSIETPHSIFNGSERSIRRFSDQTQFHSMGDDHSEKSFPERAASSLGIHKVFKRESASAVEGRMDFPGGSINSSRMRALSDRVFSRPIGNDAKDKLQASSPDTPNTASPNSAEEPDPFSPTAGNYYNSAAGFPNTPPRLGHARADSGVSGLSGLIVPTQSNRSSSGTSSIHTGRSQTSRTGSIASTSTSQTRGTMQDNDDMIAALRTQLAFHQELSAQYERDLRSREAHAALMNQKVSAYEAEAEKRSKAMRGMRKRVAELERAAAAFEELAERSAQESFERSILEGASGEAVRALHQQIIDLGNAHNEMVAREKEQKVESERLREELRGRDEQLEELKVEIEKLESADRDVEKRVSEARSSLERQEEEASMVVEQHREIEFAWAEEQARMVREAEDLRKQLEGKDSELGVLKQEVEAQWSSTEKLNSRMEEANKKAGEAEREREEMGAKVEELQKRMEEMEVEWTESENRRSQVESELEAQRIAKEDALKERDQVSAFSDRPYECLTHGFVLSFARRSSI